MTNKEKIQHFNEHYQNFESKKDETLGKYLSLLNSSKTKKNAVEKEMEKLNEQYISSVINENNTSADDNDILLKSIANKQKEIELLQTSIDRIEKLNILDDNNMKLLASSMNELYEESVQAIDLELTKIKEKISLETDEITKLCNYCNELQREYNVIVLQMAALSEFLTKDDKIMLFGHPESLPAHAFKDYIKVNSHFENFQQKNSNLEKIQHNLDKLGQLSLYYIFRDRL